MAELRLAAGENRAVYALDLIGYGLLQWCSSRYRDAHRSATEGFSIALEAGDRNPYFNTAYQRATLVLPWCLLFMGEWGEAIRDVKASVAMMNRNGDQFRAQAVEMFDAWVRLHAMDFEAVSATCQSALRLFKDPVRSAYSRFCLMLKGQAETGLGNYERALEYLSAARDALDSKTVINTWFLRMHLESAITDLWLSKGDLARARPQAEHSLQIAQAAPDRTWQALAWGANSKVSMAEGDLKHARVCIAEALSRMEGYEVPLAAWRVYATAAEIYERMRDNRSAKHYRKLSCETILKLADSLPAEEAALRKTFLSAPPISAILASVPSSKVRNGKPILVSKERYS